MKYCPYCGSALSDSVRFCAACGKEGSSFDKKSRQLSRKQSTHIVLLVILFIAIAASIVLPVISYRQGYNKAMLSYSPEEQTAPEERPSPYIDPQFMEGRQGGVTAGYDLGWEAGYKAGFQEAVSYLEEQKNNGDWPDLVHWYLQMAESLEENRP